MSIFKRNETGASVKNTLEFIQEIAILEEVEFLGLAHLLGVKLTDDNKVPREFEDIFSDIFDRFVGLRRQKRKEIMKILKEVNRGRPKKSIIEGETNGTESEN